MIETCQNGLKLYLCINILHTIKCNCLYKTFFLKCDGNQYVKAYNDKMITDGKEKTIAYEMPKSFMHMSRVFASFINSS